MKRLILSILVPLLAVIAMVTGCRGGVVRGSGDLETEVFSYQDFTRVDIGHAFEVEIIQSDTYSISITADDNLFEYIEVLKDGDILEIGLEPVITLWSSTLRAEISMPELRGIYLSGATRGTVEGFSSSDNLDINVSGASSIDLVDITAGDASCEVSGASRAIGILYSADVDFEVSGASNIQLEGSANDLTANVSGASRANLGAFTVDNADISFSGASSGTVAINPDGVLDVDLSGASRLSYIGEPIMGRVNISGASSINQK